jgi:hypothetical protein
MKLTLISESDPLEAQLMQAIGSKPFKRWQDPNRQKGTEGTQGTAAMPMRSGNQDTPLTPRLRKYMNAPTGATQGKTGYGPVDNAASRRPHLAQVDGEETNDPQDPNDLDQTSVQKKMRTRFGRDALNAQLPKPGPSQKPPS